MYYNFLKVKSLTTFLLFVTFFCNAQSNYFKWSYGFGAGVNYSRTDVVHGNWGYTFSGNIDHHFTPFVTLGLEAQYGMVQGGDIVTDPHNRQFVNKYNGINANLKIALGEFIDYKSTSFLYKIRGLYGGIGLGAIKNKITDIVRYKPSWAANDPGYGPFPGKDKSVDLWAPINLGINFYFNDKWGSIRYALNLNAQSNFTFGEGLDGYDDSSSKFKNYAPDTYNVYSIGFRYYLGYTKIYKRTL
ncbi:hypothetical protein [Pedobacter rhodius]|uniref:Outer membrane protein beta-barrel domain-containing protein n=1 Tax=Pedobacter rhodius TaxID=3004098 RepID=A0ABT4L159_9SPHI|nr:hypothetical protein [Pedobacter sp. SJ11]MCZ4223828.1 hypothetical protein [Pedobacter sp. SJ11]